MILSELVRYKQALIKLKSKLSLAQPVDSKNKYMRYIEANFSNPNYDSSIRTIRSVYKEILTSNGKIALEVDSLIEKLDKDIELAASRLLFADWNIDSVNFGQCVSPDQIDTDILERISTRIKGYCDWHYPALQINCKFKHWTDLMVTADPLYIANNYKPYIDAIVDAYPQEYQNRLRSYICSSKEITTVLPNQQFSFILSWDTLNYTKQPDVEKLLSQVKLLLRPGGVFMFSYNNCDTSAGAHLAEINNMSYLNKTKLVHYCHLLGFELIADESHKNLDSLYQNISWLEIKLPGTLTTSKAHQVLGKIMEK